MVRLKGLGKLKGKLKEKERKKTKKPAHRDSIP
jgi:hypothetical protein